MAQVGDYEFTVHVEALYGAQHSEGEQWSVEWKRGRKSCNRGLKAAALLAEPVKNGEIRLGTSVTLRTQLKRKGDGFQSKELRLRFWRHQYGRPPQSGARVYKCTVDLSRAFPPYTEVAPVVSLQQEPPVSVHLRLEANLTATLWGGCMGCQTREPVYKQPAPTPAPSVSSSARTIPAAPSSPVALEWRRDATADITATERAAAADRVAADRAAADRAAADRAADKAAADRAAADRAADKAAADRAAADRAADKAAADRAAADRAAADRTAADGAGNMEVASDISSECDDAEPCDAAPIASMYAKGTRLRFARRQGQFTSAVTGHRCSVEAGKGVVVYLLREGQYPGAVRCLVPSQGLEETASGKRVLLRAFEAECRVEFLVRDEGNPLDEIPHRNGPPAAEYRPPQTDAAPPDPLDCSVPEMNFEEYMRADVPPQPRQPRQHPTPEPEEAPAASEAVRPLTVLGRFAASAASAAKRASGWR
eukprot:TRINITY_DN28_c0_g1_i3.p1 TRINITY_DN28_c0_g1~~TRINITY_DN28_c0_g1_i3.p1  ORF type:complete len:482 (+),score=77.56 TRINITY_DN28_c0_g1_i3:55-1500(+)